MAHGSAAFSYEIPLANVEALIQAAGRVVLCFQSRETGESPWQTIASPPFDRLTRTRRLEKCNDIREDIKKTKNIDFVPALDARSRPITQLEVVWTNLKTLMHPRGGRPGRKRS